MSICLPKLDHQEGSLPGFVMVMWLPIISPLHRVLVATVEICALPLMIG
jgi:hypothetical protein